MNCHPLPVEIWENVFHYLTINEMCRISTVCKLWANLANCTSLRKMLVISNRKYCKEKVIDILKNSPQLLHLTVNGWNVLKTDNVIGNYCLNLKSLIIMSDVHNFAPDLCSIMLNCRDVRYLEIRGLCKHLPCLNCTLVYLHFFELSKSAIIICDGVNIDIQKNKQMLDSFIVASVHTMRIDMKWRMLCHNFELVNTIHRRLVDNKAINAEHNFLRVMREKIMDCICYFCDLLRKKFE